MKTMLSIALVCISLLITGCKHNTDSVVSPFPSLPTSVSITQPTATTVPAALSVTDVAALTSVTPPMLTVPNCRIVREVSKEAFDAPPTNVDADPENIIIDGQTIKVNRLSTVFYSYDEQGRISRITYGGAANAALYKSFRYDKAAIYTEEVVNDENKGLLTQRDTIVLNEQGYQRYKNSRSGAERLYDAEGYFLGYKGENPISVLVDNRNLVKTWSYGRLGDYLTYTCSYDLSRPGLPNKYQYLGKNACDLSENAAGVNLKTKLLYTNYGYNAYKNGLLRTTYYYYKYDPQGRIIAEIVQDKNEPGTGFYLVTHGGGLGITYYEYECP